MSSNGRTPAEHRFLSVMFCDMADSTAHQFRMDVEQFVELLTEYRRVVFDCVRRRGGYVSRTVGDGVLVFFGWPAASGRDAQEAVLCALDVAARMRRGIGDTSVTVRVAVETGWVLVGDIGSADGPSGLIESGGVVGHAPNVAARLQTIARVNGVVVGEGTLALLDARFITEPADASRLKLPVPITAAHVVGEIGAGNPIGRLRGHKTKRPTAPIGRAAALRALREHWDEACDGRGQVVLLAGEPGMGKSTVLAALLDTINLSESEIVALFCSAPSRNSPFQPLEEALRRAMGLEIDADVVQTRARCLDFAVQLGLSGPEAGAALAVLLGAAPATGVEPARMRRHIFDTILGLVDRLALGRPLLIFVEDIHWADPSTLELLSEIAANAKAKRVLVVATRRSHEQIVWPREQEFPCVTIGPLDEAEALALIDEYAMAFGIELDPAIKMKIVERAEGVPLFIEEFVRARAGSQADSARPPGSVIQLLSARLDSLGPARLVAQVASVLGREAPLDLLEELCGLPYSDFETALDRITDSGVMVRRGSGDSAALEFRHALLGETAYRAMSRRRQHELHHLVARTLRRLSPALEQTAPETIGHHLAEAGETAEAAALFRVSASSALKSGAFVEAETYARRAIKLIEGLPDETRLRAELAGLVPLGEALIALRGYAHPDVHSVYDRAAQIALGMGIEQETLPALRGLASFYQVRGPMARAHELGRRVLHIAKARGDALLICQAKRRHAWCMLCQGNVTDAGQLLDAALARYANLDEETRDKNRDDALTLSTLAWVRWLTDGREAALTMARMAADRVPQLSQPLTVAYALGFVAIAHQLAGDAAGVADFANRCGEIAQARGIVYWVAMARALAGWSGSINQDPAGLQRLREALEDYRRTEGKVLRPYLLGLLAEAETASGDTGAAIAALDEADEVARDIGAGLFQAPLLRLRAGLVTGTERRRLLLAAQEVATAQGSAAFSRLIGDDLAADALLNGAGA